MSAAEATAPDLPGAVEVWRAWRVVERGRTYHLGSVLKPTLWPRREALVADCLHPRPLLRLRRRRSDSHDSPALRCECGIYGTDLASVGRYLTVTPFAPAVARVLGRVSLWGTVIECERGYRASRAYPLEIYVPIDAERDEGRLEKLVDALREYGVPVELLADPSADAPGAVARLVDGARA
jgi:hypothetical protein